MSTYSNPHVDDDSPGKKAGFAECDASPSKNDVKLKKQNEAGLHIDPKHICNEKKHSCESYLEKRQSICQLSDRMKSYLMGGVQQRRQSLPPDIANVIPPPNVLNINGHLSASYEAYSCPGPPRRFSLASAQITPHITPSTSVSSFVSSLDGSFSDHNIFNDRTDEHARICFEIEKYLESLEDIDYLKLRDNSPEPMKSELVKEKSN